MDSASAFCLSCFTFSLLQYTAGCSPVISVTSSAVFDLTFSSNKMLENIMKPNNRLCVSLCLCCAYIYLNIGSCVIYFPSYISVFIYSMYCVITVESPTSMIWPFDLYIILCWFILMFQIQILLTLKDFFFLLFFWLALLFYLKWHIY